MEKNVKVSIITVVYNGDKTIEQTIKSVIKQKYNNIEYIIIDGASTDETCDIVKRYKDYIDVFVSEEDEGLYYAMNKGIQYATGEIIGILNSDDLYTEDAISKIVDCYEKNDADIVYGNAMWFDDSEERSMYSCHNIEELWYWMAIPHPATFIKKEIYKKYGLFNTQYALAADYDLVLRFFSKRVKFLHLDETLVYFRKGGLSAKKHSECIEEAKEISLQYIDDCDTKEKWLPKIEDYYTYQKFILLYLNKKRIIYDVASAYLPKLKNKEGIVIFGTGMWGERCLEILQSIGYGIDFFVDNNSDKWGSKVHDIPVEAPKKLCNYNGVVLVATYKYGKEIREQLKMLDEQLKVFSLLDWAEIAINSIETLRIYSTDSEDKV